MGTRRSGRDRPQVIRRWVVAGLGAVTAIAALAVDWGPPTQSLASRVHAIGQLAPPGGTPRFNITPSVQPSSAPLLASAPAPAVNGFVNCNQVAGRGYVDSIVTQETDLQGQGGTHAATIQPGSPYLRVVAGNPYGCAFGSVTVRSLPLGRRLSGGEAVILRVVGWVSEAPPPTNGGFWVQDTFRVGANADGSATFPRIIAAATYLGTNANAYAGNLQNAVRRMPNGAALTFQAEVNGVTGPIKRCLYKPVASGQGQGSIVCPGP